MEHTKCTDKFNFSLSISTPGHRFIAMALGAQLCDTLTLTLQAFSCLLNSTSTENRPPESPRPVRTYTPFKRVLEFSTKSSTS